MASEVKYESRLGRYAASMDRRAERATDTLGRLGQAAARARARVRTGRMRSQIEFNDRGERLEAGAPYTVYMERGTRYVSAQPMMAPAADVMAAQMGDEFEDAFDPNL